MTKKEMYTVIRNYFENCGLDAIHTPAEIEPVSVDEVMNFCDHEIELLAKKGSGSNKPTKTQVENEDFKNAILEILAEADRPLTISEMMEDERLAGLKNQRVSALVTQLKRAEMVVRTEDKKKAYFSLAE